MQSHLRRQLVFTVAMLVFGSLEAAAAYGWVGLKGAEGAIYAVGLCLVPGWFTIGIRELLKNPEAAAVVVVVGTTIRMAFVLLGLFVVGAVRPDLGFREFTLWLIPSYMVSLALETWIVLMPSDSGAVKSSE